MKRLPLILILTVFLSLIALAASGCSGTTEVNVNANTPAAATTPAAKAPVAAATPAAATTPTTTAANTGVASCDEYLAQVEKCLNNPHVPEAAKAAYRQSLETNRTAWKQAASTPQGKASLEASCKAALDGAKPFLASCK